MVHNAANDTPGRSGHPGRGPVAPTGPVAGPVSGVLFDIDDTLVDLHAAMKDAMVVAGRALLPDFGTADWDGFAALYMADAENFYDRYVAGEFTFSEQRGLRARAVFTHLRLHGFDARAEQEWIEDFERAQPRSIKAYPDVLPALDVLDAAGIPYGAVSNNVHDYQRAKLDHAGLQRIEVLVGIDTVNAAKPEPKVFWEGCRLLGTAPAETLYVGDNYLIDGVGSARAGLLAVWLDRKGRGAPSDAEGSCVRVVVGLGELGALTASPLPF
ncbi:HAD family hydrolase [Arthrobacter livingstonensis]|uniref:HAD family hydrolase n=1 Tax=Arthrobacter livingstonensis TaxID=670078 RepID=A0A2V5LBA7_9MICC|nr:HAD family hydrolase [Arthrobacter livingstonensis]PYI68829.1 HAD family hydrolase [Arthrobacter livingstonensis]